ncbi:type III pantothenate kinase [Arenimonas fontis]|uniref:Type III pantothenate kinase n=1 Tax=Arenimonas fontis TaxID=2608255 RepID=A0A5B2ZBP0_9GAMM|nr:type III pantothenate kinase [Arenimonas fontis]KAA2285407.1 type III pantothenate kinase [Arenimonas fontis]
MNWLFDLGNTRLKLAAWDGDSLGEVQALAHEAGDFADRLQDWLARVRPGDVCWLASVAASAVTTQVASALAGHGNPARRARTRARCAGVSIAYADPSRLGVDRFLALLAAHARGPGPWLLVSAGSALTVDLLDAEGRHRGGLIAPSPAHMRSALAARFPALAFAGGAACDFGSDTADALAGGSLGAAAGLIERSHRRATRLLGTAPRVLLAGGDGERLGECLDLDSEQAPALVLEGLAVYAARAGEDEPA